MDAPQLELLRTIVKVHPELRSQVRPDPPLLRWKGRWWSVAGFEVRAFCYLFVLQGGTRIQLPRPHTAACRRAALRPMHIEMLLRYLPGWKVVRTAWGTDRLRHQTGAFARVILGAKERRLAVLLALPDEPQEQAHRLLSAAILWWHRLRKSERADSLVAVFPESWSDTAVRALPHLRLPIQAFKYGRPPETQAAPAKQPVMQQVYPRPAGLTRVNSPYVMLPFAAEVPELLRELSRRCSDLDLTYRGGGWELGFRGLRLAWLAPHLGEYVFDPRQPRILRLEQFEAFEELLAEAGRFRDFPPPDPHHCFYRQGQEHWLESRVLRHWLSVGEDFTDTVYRQVPTCIDGERKVLDLLTVTADGRLAVVELKVDRDLNLVFQGLDYWERVKVHLEHGDFAEAGYFPGIRLSPEPPFLYLVCPLFEFHRQWKLLRRYLRRDIPFRLVGINANWRAEFRVLRRLEL